MTRIDRRRVLQACTATLAAGLAGCTGGGDSSDSGTPTITGLDVSCNSIEARDDPPWSEINVYPNVGSNDVEFDLSHGWPEGGVYLKRNGEAVEGWNPRRTSANRISVDPVDELVIVVQYPDGNCTRWEGIADDLDR